ncbi:MAG: hypothetical protein AB7E32_17860 [Desulfovibrio sp.]
MTFIWGIQIYLMNKDIQARTMSALAVEKHLPTRPLELAQKYFRCFKRTKNSNPDSFDVILPGVIFFGFALLFFAAAVAPEKLMRSLGMLQFAR